MDDLTDGQVKIFKCIYSYYCHCFLTEKGKQVLAEHEDAKS